MLTPLQLQAAVRAGLLAFPLTDFNATDELDTRASAARLEWLAAYRPAAFFMAAGAGEFFSLAAEEYAALLANAVRLRAGGIPVLGAAGYGTRMASAYASESERLGADGLLLLPPYLTEAPQEGLLAHIEAVCKATRLGVIVYNRANCRLQRVRQSQDPPLDGANCNHNLQDNKELRPRYPPPPRHDSRKQNYW